MALVLCTGVYPPLVETRRLLIEQEGHTVLTAISDREMIEHCRNHTFDVVVIGQTSAIFKRHAFLRIQEHCASAKVLELVVTGLGKDLEDADDWLEVPVKDPLELARCVTRLAGEVKKKAGREQQVYGSLAGEERKKGA